MLRVLRFDTSSVAKLTPAMVHGAIAAADYWFRLAELCLLACCHICRYGQHDVLTRTMLELAPGEALLAHTGHGWLPAHSAANGRCAGATRLVLGEMQRRVQSRAGGGGAGDCQVCLQASHSPTASDAAPEVCLSRQCTCHGSLAELPAR